LGVDEWLLVGTLTNNSQHALDYLTFEVTLLDCPNQRLNQRAGDVSCRTIGQQRREAQAKVPAGQTRQVSSYAISFPDLPPTDPRYERKMTWKLADIHAAY